MLMGQMAAINNLSVETAVSSRPPRESALARKNKTEVNNISSGWFVRSFKFLILDERNAE